MADTIKAGGTAITPSIYQSVSLTPSAVLAGNVSVETLTVKGLKTNMVVYANGPNLETGLILISTRVSATDTIEFSLWNVTGSTITPVAQHFFVVAF